MDFKTSHWGGYGYGYRPATSSTPSLPVLSLLAHFPSRTCARSCTAGVLGLQGAALVDNDVSARAPVLRPPPLSWSCSCARRRADRPWSRQRHAAPHDPPRLLLAAALGLAARSPPAPVWPRHLASFASVLQIPASRVMPAHGLSQRSTTPRASPSLPLRHPRSSHPCGACDARRKRRQRRWVRRRSMAVDDPERCPRHDAATAVAARACRALSAMERRDRCIARWCSTGGDGPESVSPHAPPHPAIRSRPQSPSSQLRSPSSPARLLHVEQQSRRTSTSEHAIAAARLHSQASPNAALEMVADHLASAGLPGMLSSPSPGVFKSWAFTTCLARRTSKFTAEIAAAAATPALPVHAHLLLRRVLAEQH